MYPCDEVYLGNIYHTKLYSNYKAKLLNSYLEIIIFFDQLISQENYSSLKNDLEKLQGFFINYLTLLSSINKLTRFNTYCELRRYNLHL
ncbi:hypothetical protein B1F79_03650 [Coxiella-like endosymbiont of Rhipicephalus sanguineus]|nr:hypothetical protein [Coxiella-like endosymbiont of Rhipicephalus sanguineus]